MTDYAKEFLEYNEYAASGLYETPERSLFYRKSLALRRYFEHCPIPEYNGKPLYPSGRVFAGMTFGPSYMTGINVWPNQRFRDSAPHLFAKVQEEFNVYQSCLPWEHCVAGNMHTHSMPNYERIVYEGLESYRERILKIEDKDMSDGLIDLLDGIFTYIDRCVEYLKSVDADKALISALERVPKYPAENIYEGLVCWNFIMYLDGCDNLGATARCLAPLYRGEDLVPIIHNLYENLDKCEGYSMSLDSTCPELSLQFLDAINRYRRRPMIEFFVDENTPDILWEKAFEVTRRKSGQPAFYNPKVLQDGLMKRFPSIKEEDVRKFCGGGCTEAMLMGLSNVGSLDAGINFLLILEKTLKAKLASSASFDEFYEEFIKDSHEVVDMITAGINKNREMRAKYNPLPMRSLLVDDCIDRGVDFNSFGSRYSWSIINFAGLINVIDSLLAVKDLVYDRKKYTAEELLGFLEANDEAFAAEARKLDIRYGIDDPFVNSFANKLSDELFSMLDGVELWHGLGFLPASIQFNSMAYAGMDVGATPDGRLAKEPIADSLGAIFGKDTEGPTALLNSVTSLRLDKALGVPVLNFNIQPDFNDDVLKALILGYMKKGGAQMQISCISKEDLLDALKNPDKYGSLVVRVGGYSEYFNCLEEKTKWVVINRTVQTNI